MVKPGMNDRAKQGSNEIEALVGVSDLMTQLQGYELGRQQCSIRG
jgi:hypothetical protein